MGNNNQKNLCFEYYVVMINDFIYRKVFFYFKTRRFCLIQE